MKNPKVNPTNNQDSISIAPISLGTPSCAK